MSTNSDFLTKLVKRTTLTERIRDMWDVVNIVVDRLPIETLLKMNENNRGSSKWKHAAPENGFRGKAGSIANRENGTGVLCATSVVKLW